MKKMFDEFKAFAMRGNVVDMAVGIIIGGAFGKIVSSLVSDVVMPPLGVVLGGMNFKDLKWTLQEARVDAVGAVVSPSVTLNYGQFLQSTVDFVIVAFAIFIMVKAMTAMKKKEAAAPTLPPPPPSNQEVLLTEIRDILKKK